MLSFRDIADHVRAPERIKASYQVLESGVGHLVPEVEVSGGEKKRKQTPYGQREGLPAGSAGHDSIFLRMIGPFLSAVGSCMPSFQMWSADLSYHSRSRAEDTIRVRSVNFPLTIHLQ